MPNFNEVQTNTVYCGVKVTMTFKGGNVVMGKSARLQTDDRFIQDAIEHDQRFQWGNIKLVNVVELEDTDGINRVNKQDVAVTTEDPKPKKGKKAKAAEEEEKQVVDGVKTLNDLDAWFAEQGVTLEGSSKSYIAGLCEKYNVTFPNLKY